MDDIIRFSVSLPKPLLDAVDAQLDSQKYASRSEFIRDLIRAQIVRDEWLSLNSDLMGVLTIVYNHHQSDLLTKKTNLEHHSDVEIVCTTHVHLDHENCLETMILRGSAKKIVEFAKRMGGLKSVKFSSLSKVAVTQN